VSDRKKMEAYARVVGAARRAEHQWFSSGPISGMLPVMDEVRRALAHFDAVFAASDVKQYGPLAAAAMNEPSSSTAPRVDPICPSCVEAGRCARQDVTLGQVTSCVYYAPAPAPRQPSEPALDRLSGREVTHAPTRRCPWPGMHRDAPEDRCHCLCERPECVAKFAAPFPPPARQPSDTDTARDLIGELSGLLREAGLKATLCECAPNHATPGGPCPCTKCHAPSSPSSTTPTEK
jgi:hypothetical protein